MAGAVGGMRRIGLIAARRQPTGRLPAASWRGRFPALCIYRYIRLRAFQSTDVHLFIFTDDRAAREYSK